MVQKKSLDRFWSTKKTSRSLGGIHQSEPKDGQQRPHRGHAAITQGAVAALDAADAPLRKMEEIRWNQNVC